MPRLDINLNGDGMLRDIPPHKLATTREPIKVGVLEGGMASGAPSVAIAMTLPHMGGTVLGETSLALFLSAALAMYARYGDAGTGIRITVEEP